MMGIEPAEGQPTVAPVRTTVPSRSMVSRGRASRLITSMTRSWFQTAARGQLLLDELHVQLPLDQSAQARYAQSHQRGLLCGRSDMGMWPSLKSAQEAFLFH